VKSVFDIIYDGKDQEYGGVSFRSAFTIGEVQKLIVTGAFNLAASMLAFHFSEEFEHYVDNNCEDCYV